ncbi:hypothetical protein QAD02_008474 [Eretmocerus hayati]|uniref:Uncharacterized protein n=1 Tax=Eretmocerus hayati TaxID=131215 RepID=A0ACC2N6M4_9HYME|nr:hypothetical protein QAD02_008474 [Eretmocerus hayati]
MFRPSGYKRVKKCRDLKRRRSWSDSCSSASDKSSKGPQKIQSTISESTIKRAEDLRCSSSFFSDINEPGEITPTEKTRGDIRAPSPGSASSRHEDVKFEYTANISNSRVETRNWNSESSNWASSRASTSSTRESSDNEPNASINIEEVLKDDKLTFREKLQVWRLNNIFTLTNKTITELLKLLREEGIEDLPKTAKTLLKTKRIKEVLTTMFGELQYDKDTIKIFVGIDGVSMYKSSNEQFWPIVISLDDDEYTSKPAAVAIYCGDSKPNSCSDFLYDFIEESIKFAENGIEILGQTYKFEISGIIGDTPARAFIKRCKRHCGFYACERCTTRGTKEHHKALSPLLKLTDLDPVLDVSLESMHLFFLNVSKDLFQKLVDDRKILKLSTKQRQEL